jgi:hypothetical protein
MRHCGQGRACWVAAGRPDLASSVGDIHMGPVHRCYLGTERLTSEQLRAYDPTPQELFDRLRGHVGDAGQSPDGEVFVEIADALREAPQTPRLRATLYRALALVPGVELLGAVHDRLGRAAAAWPSPSTPACAKSCSSTPTPPRSSTSARWWRTPSGTCAPVGTAIEDVVYTKRAVTDSTARP